MAPPAASLSDQGRGLRFPIHHTFTRQEQAQERVPPVASECLPHRRGIERLHQSLAEQRAEAGPALLRPGRREIIGAVARSIQALVADLLPGFLRAPLAIDLFDRGIRVIRVRRPGLVGD